MSPLKKRTPKTVLFNNMVHYRVDGDPDSVRKFLGNFGIKNEYLSYREILLTTVLVASAICGLGYAITVSINEMKNDSTSSSSEIYTPDPLSD